MAREPGFDRAQLDPRQAPSAPGAHAPRIRLVLVILLLIIFLILFLILISIFILLEIGCLWQPTKEPRGQPVHRRWTTHKLSRSAAGGMTSALWASVFLFARRGGVSG